MIRECRRPEFGLDLKSTINREVKIERIFVVVIVARMETDPYIICPRLNTLVRYHVHELQLIFSGTPGEDGVSLTGDSQRCPFLR